MKNNFYDVIVIGGGPSGLQTAYLLSRSGYKVVLFEKNPKIGLDVVCSGVISKEAFDRYDLPGESVAGALGKADLYSPSGKHIPYIHPSSSVLVVDRCRFDSLLAQRARNEGTDIKLFTKVKGVIPGESVVKVITSSEGVDTIYKAKLAVISTGVSFKLQESLGMGRPERIVKGIHVDIPSIGLDRLKMFWGNNISKGFFGWAIPLNDGRARIGVMSHKNPMEGLKNILHRLKLDHKLPSVYNDIKKRGISHGMINKSYSNRVLATGEACGLVKTTTGGGIYYGLISAEYAARVIDKAFNLKRYDEQVLSEYEEHLNREFSGEIRMGKHFHNFYSGLSDKDIDSLFDAAISDELLEHIAHEGKFDWHTNTIYRILRSSNLSKVLLKGIIRQGMSKLAIGS